MATSSSFFKLYQAGILLRGRGDLMCINRPLNLRSDVRHRYIHSAKGLVTGTSIHRHISFASFPLSSANLSRSHSPFSYRRSYGVLLLCRSPRGARRRELRGHGCGHVVHRRRHQGLGDRRRLLRLDQRQVVRRRRHASVQLREQGAHGDGGEPGRLHVLLRQQRGGQRRQRRHHRHARDPRHALLHLQHPRPLRKRHEARRHRRRGRLVRGRLHPVRRLRRGLPGPGDGRRRRRGGGGSDQGGAVLNVGERARAEAVQVIGRFRGFRSS